MNISCTSIGMSHDWGKWRKSTAQGMNRRPVKVCRRCGVRRYAYIEVKP